MSPLRTQSQLRQPLRAPRYAFQIDSRRKKMPDEYKALGFDIPPLLLGPCRRGDSMTVIISH
jgi:hypothetical protein